MCCPISNDLFEFGLIWTRSYLRLCYHGSIWSWPRYHLDIVHLDLDSPIDILGPCILVVMIYKFIHNDFNSFQVEEKINNKH